MTATPELPDGWGWWSGNRGPTHYTRWFGTEFRMGGHLAGHDGLGGYEGEVYWDEGGDHHVAIYPIVAVSDDDPVLGYAVYRGTFDTERDALDAVPDAIKALGD